MFKGSNLIRQVVIAKTEAQSVAYKYDGGLKGLPLQAATRVSGATSPALQDSDLAALSTAIPPRCGAATA